MSSSTLRPHLRRSARHALVVLALGVLPAGAGAGPDETADPWAPIRFLAGEWQGSATTALESASCCGSSTRRAS